MIDYKILADCLIKLWSLEAGISQAQLALVTSPGWSSTRNRWLDIYHWKVKQGLTPIEKLSIEEKQDLWKSTIEIAGENANSDISRCLYTIEKILHENEKANSIRETKEESTSYIQFMDQKQR